MEKIADALNEIDVQLKQTRDAMNNLEMTIRNKK